MSKPRRYCSESRRWWEGGRERGAQWAFEGRPKAARQVGEPEGTSVIKAGACQCALRGRESVKPGGTAEAMIASVPAVKLGTEAFFFCPGIDL